MVTPRSSDDLEQEELRARLKLDTLRLILGAVAVPLPLIAVTNSTRFQPLFDLLGIPLNEVLPFVLVITGAAAMALGWVMILPLLVRHAGWRAQIACLIAVCLSVETALLLAGLVQALSHL